MSVASSANSLVSKSQSDINIETNLLKQKYYQLLQPNSVTSSGPNSHPPHAFGRTSKLGSSSSASPISPAKESKNVVDLELKDIENWKKYNEIGQTIPRKRIVQTYGKLNDPPGPGDYTPNERLLSTSEPSHQYSLHDRTFYQPVGVVDTPGPGTYESHSGIQVAFERFRRDPLPETQPPTCKVGPGSYTPARSVEFGKFHREIAAVLPRRDKGVIRRPTVDLQTLYIHKSSKKQKKPKELPTSHLGPGTYFNPSDDQIPVTDPSIDLSATAKMTQWATRNSNTTTPTPTTTRNNLSSPPSNIRKSVFYDIDPMVPSRRVFTIGQKRPDAALISDPSPPGPGSYSPDRSLFGSTLLKEGGGAVTRPGKLSSTTSSEGTIPGQHAPAIYSLPVTKSSSKLLSHITHKNPDGTIKHITTAHWKPSSYLQNSQEKTMQSALRGVKRYHNCGRGTESSIPEREYVFRGKNSSGSYMKFNGL